MKLGHRKNKSANGRLDADYVARRDSARSIAIRADMFWRYYARKVGIDPLTVTESPLTEIANASGDPR